MTPTGPGGLSVSVIICAHLEERLADTMAAVNSVQRQSLAPAEIIVVVDHNPVLHQQLKSALPDLAVVENQEAPGLSGGKNTGIAMARGDVVAFLDDDAVADPGWLKFFADAYSDPAIVGVGGLTLPAWDTRRPSWFPAEFDWVIGCSYLGMPTSAAPVRNLHGGNASFRREVFAVVGGFRSGIGRSASKRPRGPPRPGSPRTSSRRPCAGAARAAAARPASGPAGSRAPGGTSRPVLVENSGTSADLGFHAVCRYSLISPASLARRWIRAAGPGKAMTSGLSSGARRPMPLP